MRKINKGGAFQDFQHFVDNNHTSDWSDLDGNLRRNTRQHILENEQDYMCGYTEMLLVLDDSHIDHFRKRILFSNLRFEWDNLIVAVKDSDFGANFKDNKIKLDDYSKILNPVVDNPHEYFAYTNWGKIIPKEELGETEKFKAQNTINLFNLNHKTLMNQRQKYLRLTESCIPENSFDDFCGIIHSFGFKSIVEYVYNKY